jgi:hypothetical protein
LINGKASTFTVPLEKASQNKFIKDILIASDANWKGKLLKSIELAYKKAPYFGQIYTLVERILYSNYKTISELVHQSISILTNYLEIKTNIIATSEVYETAELKGAEKIIAICLKESASHYINPEGGKELYNKDFFLEKGLKLSFLKPHLVAYPQFKNEFVPGLSILDVMMFNNLETLRKQVYDYELVA